MFVFESGNFSVFLIKSIAEYIIVFMKLLHSVLFGILQANSIIAMH